MSGFVYAIGDETGRVKIGWSADPLRRLNKISSDCSSTVTLFGLVPATKGQEAEIQSLLKPWKANREWFRFEGPVKAFVDMLSRPEPRPIAAAHPLKTFRKKHNPPLSQEDLASLLGVDRVTVARWELQHRFPERKFWKAIEDVTGISISDLAVASTASA
jgi:DNA-binding XRE family transcriptional regulator